MDFRLWNCHQVAQWLESDPQLRPFAANIIDHNIHGAFLLALTDSEIKELGFEKVGDRKAFQAAIKQLSEFRVEGETESQIALSLRSKDRNSLEDWIYQQLSHMNQLQKELDSAVQSAYGIIRSSSQQLQSLLQTLDTYHHGGDASHLSEHQLQSRKLASDLGVNLPAPVRSWKDCFPLFAPPLVQLRSFELEQIPRSAPSFNHTMTDNDADFDDDDDDDDDATITQPSPPRDNQTVSLVDDNTDIEQGFKFTDDIDPESRELILQLMKGDGDIIVPSEPSPPIPRRNPPSPAPSMTDTGSDLFCEICYTERPEGDFYGLSDCTHRYCRSCYKEYVQSKVANGDILKCINPDCFAQFTARNLKDIDCHDLVSFLVKN
eukprot:TRINITY_DN1313_c0_g2_i1.p1 TRINITY_DN1313_c0_g2~~TRINITY_DN1313_c0_g2_i1.p1  ORF type:complete len:377 (+),score=163.60 TRINITY_DN1313_c0_g2_i1:231-1361(+)